MVDLWLYVRVAAMQLSRMMIESTVLFIYQPARQEKKSLKEMIRNAINTGAEVISAIPMFTKDEA